MSFADSSGVRIHYEVTGEGTPLVLLHGIGETLEVWHLCGYVDALHNEYRLILIDARGNSPSDAPPDPRAYTTAAMAHDVVAVLDSLEIECAHYFGFSMGGMVGYGTPVELHHRFVSMILAGANPYFGAAERQKLAGAQKLLAKGPAALLVANEYAWQQPLPDRMREKIERHGAGILKDAFAVTFEGNAENLSRFTVPCLIMAGDKDGFYEGAEASARELLDARFVSLPGLDHIETLRRSDLILPHVRPFLKEIEGRP